MRIPRTTSSHAGMLGSSQEGVLYDLGFKRISAAGPSSTIHRVGKMQPTIGSIIFKVACAAFSCARWRRFRRISSAWIRIILPIPVPNCSDWIIAWMKLLRS